MRALKKAGAAIALGGMLMTGVHAAALDETSSKLINMTAQFTEMGLACGETSASDASAGKAKQRQVMQAQGIDAQSYDKAYDAASADFRKKWAALPAEKQKSTCAGMKRKSQESAARLKESVVNLK